MTLLQRRLLWSVLGACGAAVALLTWVMVLGNFLKDLLGSSLAGQIAPATLLKAIALLIPHGVTYALPMGVLTGVLLVLGRMSAQHEITAIRAAGLSLGWIARPVWLLASLGVVAGWFINFQYMPVTRTAYKQLLVDAVREDPVKLIVPRTFIREFPRLVVYVGDKQDNELRDVWLWRLDEQKRVLAFARAASGRLDYVEADGKLVLVLSDVTTEVREEDAPEDFTKPPPVTHAGEVRVDILLDGLFGTQSARRKLSYLTLSELRAEQAALAAADVPWESRRAHALSRLRVSMAIHEKASMAVAVLAFALVGVPLGIRVSRQETSANLGVALAIVLTYYVLTVMIGWLDEQPELRPDLLLWVPPLLFSAFGIWLLRRVERA